MFFLGPSSLVIDLGQFFLKKIPRLLYYWHSGVISHTSDCIDGLRTWKQKIWMHEYLQYMYTHTYIHIHTYKHNVMNECVFLYIHSAYIHSTCIMSICESIYNFELLVQCQFPSALLIVRASCPQLFQVKCPSHQPCRNFASCGRQSEINDKGRQTKLIRFLHFRI